MNENPQSEQPQEQTEMLSLVVSAVLKDGTQIDEPMDIKIPFGQRNYPGLALNTFNALAQIGGLSHKLSDKEFEFYMIPDIAKFKVAFGHISAATAPAVQS